MKSHDARFVEDVATLNGCELILLEDPQVFGISCHIETTPMVAVFDDYGGKPGPILGTIGPCVSYGTEFIVDYEPKAISFFHGHALQLRDLVITADGSLLLISHGVHGPSCVNLMTGEVEGRPTRGAVVREWTISIKSPSGDERHVIYRAPPRS